MRAAFLACPGLLLCAELPAFGTSEDLGTVDRAMLNAFQGGFPVVERPFEPAAAALADHGVDIDADELLARVQDLDDAGVLTRFGALVNAEAIGGTATLVAITLPRTDTTRWPR